MFRTLIFGLAALILGMLAYLYTELSALRQTPPPQLILTITEDTHLPPGRYQLNPINY